MFSGTFATCSEGTTLPSSEQSRGSGPGHFMVCPAKAAFDLSLEVGRVEKGPAGGGQGGFVGPRPLESHMALHLVSCSCCHLDNLSVL